MIARCLPHTLPAILVATLVALLPAACRGTDRAERPAATEPSYPDDEIAAAAREARDDLAGRLGVSAAEVTVAVADRVTWNDGSIGCAEPGQAYAQATVPGYRIVLAYNSHAYHYHGADGTRPLYCEDPTPAENEQPDPNRDRP